MDGSAAQALGARPSPQSEDPPSRWDAIVSLALGVFALVTAEFLPASVLTPIAADLGVSVGAAGQAVTATAVIGAIAAPLVPVLTRRSDRRLVMLALISLLFLSNLLTALAQNLPMLLVARLLLGVSLGGFWSMAAALALRLVPARKLPRAMSIVFTGVSAATVSAAPIGAYVGDLWGWRSAFLIAGAVGLLALVTQFLTLPRLAPTGTSSLRGLVEVGRSRAMLVALAVVVLLISGHFAGFTYIRPVLEEVTRLDVRFISLVLLGFGLAGFVGNFIGAVIAERDPKLAVIGGGVLIVAAAWAVTQFAQVGWLTAGAYALWGFAFAFLPVGFQSWVTSQASDRAELAGGLLTATFQVGIAAGAVLGGLMVDGFGPTAAAAYAGGAALLGVGVVVATRDQRRQRAAVCEAC